MIASNSASSSAYDVSMMHASSGRTRANVAADLDSGAVRQANVEHGDIGACGRDPVARFFGGARLADDFEVLLRFEEIAHAAADDLVVIEQEHLDGHRGQSALVSRATLANPSNTACGLAPRRKNPAAPWASASARRYGGSTDA